MLGVVLFYGVVSARTEKVVAFFFDCEAAEALIGDDREDEPALAEEMRVEAIELRVRLVDTGRTARDTLNSS